MSRERPSLSQEQRIEFLELIAGLATPSIMERKLDLSPSDIEHYKRELDVTSPDEARRKARRMRTDFATEREARIMAENAKAKEAQRIAQARLEELEARRNQEAAERTYEKPDINEIRKEDAERQRRLEASQSSVQKPNKEWKLPIEDDGGTITEQIDRFRRNIVYRGMSFTCTHYNATPQQIRYEASRLGIKVNWDIVRR